MSEPETVDGEKSPESWPLHEKVVKALKGSSPFGLLLAWAVFLPILMFLASSVEFGSRSPEICTGLGFGCRPGPVTSALIAVIYAIPGLVVVSLVLLVMTIFRASLRARLWMAGIGPPLSFFLFALLS